MTYGTLHVTHDIWHMVEGERSLKIWPSYLLQFLDRQCVEDISTKDDLISQWITKVFVE